MNPAIVTERLADFRRVGSLPKDDPAVGTGFVMAAGRGDRIRIQIRVAPAGDTIVEARFKAFGCSASIAAAGLLAERVEGLSVEAASRLRAGELATTLSLEPERLYSGELAVHALQGAIADYCQKRLTV